MIRKHKAERARKEERRRAGQVAPLLLIHQRDPRDVTLYQKLGGRDRDRSNVDSDEIVWNERRRMDLRQMWLNDVEDHERYWRNCTCAYGDGMKRES